MGKKIIRIIAGAPPNDKKTKEEFHNWLDEEHVRNLFKFKKMKRATNYRIINKGNPKFEPEFPGPEFITVMEFESEADYEEFEKSPEMATCIKNGLDKWGPDIGYKKLWWFMYESSLNLER
ncbi:MAG: hypothetical protein JXA79_13660 [Deltaproteobacteria bacterium]|nr:hypothetical protein [Deltaproteobacteria bacterium]